MRIVHTSGEPEFPAVVARRARRTANLEALGLLAASAVVLFGLVLTTWGRLIQLNADDRDAGTVVSLRHLAAPTDLVPLLTMVESPQERLLIELWTARSNHQLVWGAPDIHNAKLIAPGG